MLWMLWPAAEEDLECGIVRGGRPGLVGDREFVNFVTGVGGSRVEWRRERHCEPAQGLKWCGSVAKVRIQHRCE